MTKEEVRFAKHEEMLELARACDSSASETETAWAIKRLKTFCARNRLWIDAKDSRSCIGEAEAQFAINYPEEQ